MAAKVRAVDLSVDRNAEGAVRVAAIVGGWYVTRVYYGYARREAIRKFLAEQNGGK